MNRFPAVAIAITAALAAVFGSLWVVLPSRWAAPAPAAALPVYGTVPDFSLTAHDGRPLTNQELAGSVWVADFIFARCAGQCPMMHQAMQRLAGALRDLPSVRFVSFTVDPAYDTPQRLAELAASLGAAAGRWDFVTGSQDAIWSLARKGFKLGVGDSDDPREPILHSTRLVLVDQAGRIRAWVDAGDAGAIERAAAHARALAAEGAR